MSCKWFFCSIAVTGVLAASAFEWKFEDGENSLTVRENSRTELNGKITGKTQALWSWEDDRKWSLALPAGAVVQIPHHEDLNFKDGFHASLYFSCDLSRTGRTNFQNLFTKGLNFQQGYSVMIQKNGVLMLNLRGLKPEYKLVRVGLESNKEHQLDIYVGNGKVQIFVDGNEKASYAYTGSLNYTGNNKPLFLGNPGAYAFSGVIHNFKIEPYSPPGVKKKIIEKSALESFRPVPLPHPAGTVIFKDFTLFQPASAVKKAPMHSEQLNTWICRTRAFTPHNTYTLYPPLNIDAPVLRYAPGLRGRYDVYVNVRAIHRTTSFQTRLSKMSDYFTVRVATMGNIHRNMDLCLARDVEMDDQVLEVASCGDMAFINCFKFIPAGKVGADFPQDPAGSVTREERFTYAKFNAALKQEIAENIQSGMLKERCYVDEKTAPPVSVESAGRGFVLFPRLWMDLLFDNSVPDSDPGQVTLRAKAAANEYEPVTLGIKALKKLDNVSLRLSKGLGDDVSVTIDQVEFLDKRTTSFVGRSEFMRGPNYLMPHEKLAMKAGETRQFWITLHAGKNARPGIRTGELLLTADGKSETIFLTLEIRPFILDAIRDYDIGFWVATSAESEAEINTMIKTMAAHNMTSMAVNGVFTISGNEPDKVVIDFENSMLTKIAGAFKRHNMTGNILLSSDQLAMYGTENLKRLVKDTENYARKHDWPPILWTIYDEVPSHPELFPAFIANLKALKECNVPVYADHVWFRTLRPLAREVAEASQYIDTFILRYNTRNNFYADTWDQIQNEAAARGRKVYAYNSNNAITFAQPAGMRFASGWFFRSFGNRTRGHIIWTYNSSKGSPYTDLDGNCCDWQYVYPDFAGRRGGYAIDYEAFREGGDDLRYIQKLEKAIVKARQSGKKAAADEAQKVLDSLAGSFDKAEFAKKSVYISSVWDKKYENDGRRYASGRYNLPNKWTLEDYDRARDMLAEAIIKLGK